RWCLWTFFHSRLRLPPYCVEWQHMQLPFRTWRSRCDAHLPRLRRKTKHLDLNAPDTVRQIFELVCALLVRRGDQLFLILSRHDRGARHWKASRHHHPVMLRGRKSHRKASGEDRYIWISAHEADID